MPLTRPVRKDGDAPGAATGSGTGRASRVSRRSGPDMGTTWVPSFAARVSGRSRAYAIRETGGLPAPRDSKGLVRVGRSGVMYVLHVRVSLLFGALPQVAIDDQRRNR